MKKTNYPDYIRNAFNGVQAWRTAALVLGALFCFTVVVLVWQGMNRTVLLMPQYALNTKEPVAINLGAPFNPDYLTAIAKGDADSLLNWTPETIDQQYGRFLGRLVPALHDAQRELLINESKTHIEEGLTQSFYPVKSLVNGASVTLSGVLVRSMGGREIFRGNATYIFSYHNTGGGYLSVAGVSQPQSGQPQAQSAAAAK